MYGSYSSLYPRHSYSSPSYGYTDRYRNRYSNLEYEPSPYWNYDYIYGPNRSRPYSWERDYERYRRFRRRSRRSRRVRRERDDSEDSGASDREDSPPPKPPTPKPEPPPEEIVKILKVKSVDLHIKANTEKHKTDKFDCTEERKDDDTGKSLPAELVVRRGDSFKLSISFDRPYDKEDNDALIIFSLGEDATANKGSLAEMEVDETGKKKFGPEEWGANLHGKTGNDITVMVHIPANCIVGEWNLSVKSLSMGKDKDGKDTTLVAQYKHDTDVTILFNPWCKHDGVYMATEDLLNEYILNDYGCVYQGSAFTRGAKDWYFGQHEEVSLDAAMYLLRAGFRRPNSAAMSDPIKASRAIAKMVNQAGDNGVLVGNWSGEYEGGTSPTKWIGSVKILKEYMKNMSPVKYGQCWVFSCVTTTICRALGIPCRSITNFASAHDTEGSNTIDKHFKHVRRGPPEPLRSMDSDSIWNFHVWNEVWLARPDLEQTGLYGWQVIDATPQELSDNVYTCGPCPVAAVKRGLCRTQYDCGFVFSEVNADEIHWLVTDTGLEYLKKKRQNIGKNISTKVPDGKPYNAVTVPRNSYSSLSEIRRLDVTHEYKYPEGSTEERNAVLMAHRTAASPRKGAYGHKEKTNKLRIKLIHSNEVLIGSELPIEVKLINNSRKDRKAVSVTLTVYQKNYIGEVGKAIVKKDLGDAKIGVGKEVILREVIKPADYVSNLLEQASLLIVASTVFTGGRRNKARMTEHEFRFRRPDLEVELAKKATRGDTVRVEVSFTNPLNMPLTMCDISMESRGFKNIADEKQKDVPANGVFQVSFNLVAKRAGEHSIMFSFDCKELKDIMGSGDIVIERG